MRARRIVCVGSWGHGPMEGTACRAPTQYMKAMRPRTGARMEAVRSVSEKTKTDTTTCLHLVRMVGDDGI